MDAKNTYLGQLIIQVGKLIKLALPIVLGIALLYFLWGVAIFIFKANNDKEREEGKKKIVYGLVALFVMVTVWGIVKLLGVIFLGNPLWNGVDSLDGTLTWVSPIIDANWLA